MKPTKAEILKRLEGLDKVMEKSRQDSKQTPSEETFNRSRVKFFLGHNSYGTRLVLDELLSDKFAPAKKAAKTLRVAVGVGLYPFYCAKLLNRYEIDIVFCVDITPDMLTHASFQRDMLLESDSPADFKKRMQKHPLIGKEYKVDRNNKPVFMDKSTLIETIEQGSAEEAAGKYHFLSEDSFTEYKKFFSEKAVYMTHYDMTSLAQTQLLKKEWAERFSGYELECPLYVPDNIFDYDAKTSLYDRYEKGFRPKKFVPTGNLMQCANELCKDTKPLVLCSLNSFRKAGLIYRSYIGLTEYAEKLKLYASIENEVRANPFLGSQKESTLFGLSGEELVFYGSNPSFLNPIASLSSQAPEIPNPASMPTPKPKVTDCKLALLMERAGDLGRALRIAAANNYIEQLETLLKSKDCSQNPAVINSQDDKVGMTPLHWAVKKDHLTCVERLLAEQSTNINILDKSGHTAKYYAEQGSGKNKDKILELLKKHQPPKYQYQQLSRSVI